MNGNDATWRAHLTVFEMSTHTATIFEYGQDQAEKEASNLIDKCASIQVCGKGSYLEKFQSRTS